MQKPFLAALVTGALATSALGLVAAAPAQAAGNTIVVDAGAAFRPVTHVAAGGLYGLASSTVPSTSLLMPLHLKQLTQPAPGVQQLGNGATTPTGDALKVAPSATAAGARTYIRMPDIYKDFPYKWVSWSDWESKVTSQVNARLAATGTTNINGWELWNEPDWTWNTSSAGSFTAGWARTFKKVRGLDTITPIVGPSYSRYDHTWMLNFMTAAKASGTVPDVAVWHELEDGTWGTVGAHVADYRAIESSLGITPRPISINEYGSINQGDTVSVAAHYMAAFERHGIEDGERAYWYESGTMDGLIYNNAPTGMYWLYKWYGEMAGNMVTVTPSGDFDAAASYDSTRKIVNVVAGGVYGTNYVQVKGISSFGSSAKATVLYTPSNGRHANVSAPTTVSSATYTISNGSITVPIVNQDYLGGYQVLVTPAAGPTTSYQQRYEAENASFNNARIQGYNAAASEGAYVGFINNSGDMRNDSFVDFIVNVPSSGTYTMTVRYANGSGATATQGLAYNGSAWSTISYPVTSGWGVFGSVTKSVTLNSGYNVIRLAKGSPYFAGGANYAELDYISLTK